MNGKEIEMNKKSKLCLVSCMLLLFMAGCANAALPSKPELDGSEWVLFAIRKSRPIPNSTLTIAFDGDQVNGSAGCNSYFGTYKIKNDEISFSAIGMTEMACMEPEGIMEQEMEFISYLQDAIRFKIEENRLSIIRPDGETLTFDRIKK